MTQEFLHNIKMKKLKPLVLKLDLKKASDLAKEWDLYCRTLTSSGIHLQDIDDKLKWIEGDKSGVLTVKNFFCAISSKIWQWPIGGWRKKMWT